jgi:hypothetical protein
MDLEVIIMNPRNSARLVGVLFIIATVAPITAALFLGFLGGAVSGEPIPDYLVTVSANEMQVIIGMLIELIWALAVVGIPVVLFPILKKYNEALALGFFSLRFIEAISTILHSIILLVLLTLSQEFVTGVLNASYYLTLSTLLLAAREWVFNIGSGLVWSLSALLLNYILYRSKLIPQWLSGWGLVGGTLSFITYLLQFFSINLTDFLFLPIAVQEMVFAVWLIVKGFNLSTIVSESASS